MFKIYLRRSFIGSAALLFAAGCSGNSLAPSQTPPSANSAIRIVNGMRVVPGPSFAGPLVVPLAARKPDAPAGWPAHKKKKKSYLFVADASSGVLIYDPKTPNASAIGSITNGVDIPSGLAVDTKGALYVTNDGNNTVTIYPKGQSSPSLTISSGVSGPYGIGVDSRGDIFVTNLNNDTITAYTAGATTPYATITFAYGQPLGVGVDAMDNVWIASNENQVLEMKAGTTQLRDSGILGLDGPLSVAFGPKDVIYVSNFSSSDVNIYKYGTYKPSATITTGIEKDGPTLGGFTHSGAYFQSNQNSNVVGYKPGATTPFSTLQGAATPLGIASEPLVEK